MGFLVLIKMKKIIAIIKLIKSNEFILFTDKQIIGDASDKFIQKAMFNLMDYSISEVEQRMAVEEAKEIINQ